MTIIHQNKGSTWATKYWNEGPEAAQAYCGEICEQIEKVVNLFNTLAPHVAEKPEVAAALRKLTTTFANTKANYANDCYVLEERWSEGRMEPGKTPFNYPSFQRRYLHQKDLDKHIQRKIQTHQSSWDRLAQLLQIEGLPNKEDLKALQNYHAASIQKWKARATLRTEHPQNNQTPLDVMQISALHDSGYFGQGSKVIVLESGADVNHSSLKGVIVNAHKINEKKEHEDEHGTHVCGSIAAKKNVSLSHVGVAPLAKLAISNNMNDQTDSIEAKFFNWSGHFANPFIDLINETNEKLFNLALANLVSRTVAMNITVGMWLVTVLQLSTIEEKKAKLSEICEALQLSQIDRVQLMMKDKLLFQALGNSGVDVSQNPKEFSLKSRYQTASLVFVVNLLRDGCTPNDSTNFPGVKFKNMTVCAIGTKVLSTVPGDKYKELTGTSMATAYVTGIAALLEGAFPELTIEEIRECILHGATPIITENGRPILLKNFDKHNRPKPSPYFGWGLVSGVGAFNHAKEIMAAKHS